MGKESKILVLGGTGMVGSALIRRLIEKGYRNIISNYYSKKPDPDLQGRVSFFELDLTRQDETEEFFFRHKPDYVFLAAAKVGGILANSTYKAEFLYENLAIALHTIRASFTTGVKKLLNLGSSCIYPKHAPQPMKEEYLLTGSLEPTNEPYAISKIAAIKLVRYYNEQYGTNFISVMPTNLYGPNDNFNLETSHLIPALIRKFHLGKLLENGDFESIRRDLKRYPIGFGLEKRIDFKDKSSIVSALDEVGIKMDRDKVRVIVWGSGNVYREFLHVNDLADACTYLMEEIDAWDMCYSHPRNKDKKVVQPAFELPDYFVNVGTGEDLLVRDLAKLIKEIVGFKGEIDQDLSKPDGTPRKLLDVSRMRNLGWQPRISLEEGIKKTYIWYLDSQTQLQVF
ncbi:MAG: GDP-L-fucose synthase [Desulfobacterota bacterium]|nr:GDP-L-fucose synthase [Thermodesulfobacteriota bacterium]MDW8001818.1 GDP-L-fucose synthase [Deltaproteobacteria bacterium]